MAMTIGSEAKVTKKQHTKPCHDCPWRRVAIPGWLGSHTAEEWVSLAHGEGRIECHALTKSETEGWQCAGAATFRANVCKSVRDPNALQLPQNTQLVFSWDDEFLAYHEEEGK